LVCRKSQPSRTSIEAWDAVKGIKKPTVTAHFSTLAEVEAFDKYATSCSLNRQSGAAWLLTAELKEQWLEKALSLKGRPRRPKPPKAARATLLT
jgi:hypothetical protein